VPIIDVNLEDNPFSELAGSRGGVVLRERGDGRPAPRRGAARRLKNPPA
jgi:hypothetical protein